MLNKYVLFGYSGHSYVIIEILKEYSTEITGYFTKQKALKNPYALDFLGFEGNPKEILNYNKHNYFVAIGDNMIRKKISDIVRIEFGYPPSNVISKKAIVSDSVLMGRGVMIGAGSIINALTSMGDGVICNTGSIIEHECVIGDYSHIAPGAILCGNVKIGSNTLIGAGAVVLPGVSIGDHVIIGAGTTVTSHIDHGSKIVGAKNRIIQI